MKMKLRITRYIVLLMAICFGCSCEKVQEVQKEPRFDLVLLSEIFFSGAIHTDQLRIAICVNENDEKYLYDKYVLSLETLYGTPLQLICFNEEDKTNDISSEIKSTEIPLRQVSLFDENNINSEYSSYTFFFLNQPISPKTSFRAKLHFEESGKTYYTKIYTLVGLLRDYLSSYWLVPGLCDN